MIMLRDNYTNVTRFSHSHLYDLITSEIVNVLRDKTRSLNILTHEFYAVFMTNMCFV